MRIKSTATRSVDLKEAKSSKDDDLIVSFYLSNNFYSKKAKSYGFLTVNEKKFCKKNKITLKDYWDVKNLYLDQGVIAVRSTLKKQGFTTSKINNTVDFLKEIKR